MTNDLLEREEGLPIPEEGTAQPEGMNARQPDDSPQGEGPSEEAARMETSQLPQEESSPEEEKAQPEISGGPKTSEAPQEGESAPEAQEEKTVFAPSVWEQRSARKAQAQTRQEEAQARRAQQETQRQDKAAQREAQKLELKLLQEQRRAEEEQRRQERRHQDEERRQEQKRRAEEERLPRRGEKAKQKTVRRVGTMTLGVSLILIGVAILLYMMNPSFDIRIISYLAPLILISLGVEVLIRYFFSKDRTYKYDFASGLICIFLVMGSFCVALVPYAMYYISPERFTSEAELLQAEREKLYNAFKGDQRVEVFYVNGGVDYGPVFYQKAPDGRYVYELSYLRTRVHLLDGYASQEEFAQVCRELLSKMEAQGIYTENFGITFESRENDERVYYALDIDNRLKLEMDVQNLVKLVDTIYTQPNLENGWLPNGYDEIAANWGSLYADHFADLVENYSDESRNIYYSLLMNEARPDLAENYYQELTAGGEGPIVPPEEQVEGEETPSDQEEPPAPENSDAPAGEDNPAGDAEQSES